jgi:hypothetical protein
MKYLMGLVGKLLELRQLKDAEDKKEKEAKTEERNKDLRENGDCNRQTHKLLFW